MAASQLSSAFMASFGSPYRDPVVEIVDMLAQMYDKELDRKEKKETYALALLSDELRLASAELRQEEKDYRNVKEVHEDLFGQSQEVGYTYANNEILKDIDGMHINAINRRRDKANFLSIENSKKMKEIRFIKRAKSFIPALSKEKGTPGVWDGPDFTPEAIAPQLIGKEDAKGLETAIELLSKWQTQQPEFVSPGVIEAMNLLDAKSKAQAAGYEKIDFNTQVTRIQNTLAQSDFMTNMKSLYIQLENKEINKEAFKKRVVNLFPTPDGTHTLGSILSPERGKITEKTDIEPFYTEIADTYTLFSSYVEGKGVDALGLLRFTSKMEGIYNSDKMKSLPEARARFRQYLLDNLNFDVSKPDQFIFPEYNDAGDITPRGASHGESKLSLELAIKGSYMSKYPGEITEKNLDEFFGDKERQKLIKSLYIERNPDLDDSQINSNVKGVYYSLHMNIKKKSKKDVIGIRSRLTESGYSIVDVTADTGYTSVLAEGKARIRLAEPMAEKFIEAKSILKDMGIDLQVADTLVDYGVKKESYQKWLAGGKKGPKVADPDRSFHTIGYAFDLAQTLEMKKPEVAEVLRSIGLVPHETEWWHWSLEEI